MPASAPLVGRDDLLHLLKQLPPVDHAFAYGSGVLPQPGLYDAVTSSSSSTSLSSGGPQVDLLLAVSDSEAWHAAALAPSSATRSHYSWLLGGFPGYPPNLGAKAVVTNACRLGVGVHFNTLVPMCPRPGEPPLLVKYGVMSVSDLLDDLVTWRHLYAAGRLHKPVVRLGEGGEAKEEVAAGQRRNQDAALAAALLLLPHRFTTRQLLSTIVGLSYSGDVRLGLAEDARKVERLVSGGRAELEEVYVRRGLLLTQALAGGGGASTACSGEAEGQWHVFNSPAKLAGVVKEAEEHASDRVTRQTCGVDGGSRSSNDTVVIGGGEGCSWRQDVGMASRRSLLEALPVALLAEVAKQAGAWPQQASELSASVDARLRVASAVASSSSWSAGGGGQQLASGQHLVRAALRSIVGRSSRRQAVSGLTAAGLAKAVQYVGSKVAKAWASRGAGSAIIGGGFVSRAGGR